MSEGIAAGAYGIREPISNEAFPPEQIDLIVVPAMAFGADGARLGRGGGFYDRFLSQPDLRAATCGLAFHEQVLDAVPTGEHDCPVMVVVTDKEVLRFSG